MRTAVPSCFRLEIQVILRAFSRARAKTGKRIAARMAIMAITTRSSMSVNAGFRACCMCSLLRDERNDTHTGRRGPRRAESQQRSFVLHHRIVRACRGRFLPAGRLLHVGGNRPGFRYLVGAPLVGALRGRPWWLPPQGTHKGCPYMDPRTMGNVTQGRLLLESSNLFLTVLSFGCSIKHVASPCQGWNPRCLLMREGETE